MLFLLDKKFFLKAFFAKNNQVSLLYFILSIFTFEKYRI